MVIQKQKPEESISVWQPLKDLEETGKRFGELNGRPVLRAMWRRPIFEEMVWAPAVDVIEKETNSLLKSSYLESKRTMWIFR